MFCPTCHRPMTALFLHYACDWCDGLMTPAEEFTGFIVWRDRALPSMEYVFPSEAEASKWREAKGLDDAPIRAVKSHSPFHWRQSTGSLADLTLADRLYEIHPDQRYAPSPQRAHISAQAA